MRAEPERCLVFSLGLRGLSALREKIRKRRAGFRPLGVGPLRGDEFPRRGIETLAIVLRLAGGRDGGEQRSRPNPHAAHGIGEERSYKRPELIGRNVFEHV